MTLPGFARSVLVGEVAVVVVREIETLARAGEGEARHAVRRIVAGGEGRLGEVRAARGLRRAIAVGVVAVDDGLDDRIVRFGVLDLRDAVGIVVAEALPDAIAQGLASQAAGAVPYREMHWG